MSCPACGSAAPEVFLRTPPVPVLCHQLAGSRREALGVPRAEIALGHCPGCGLVHNAAFDPRRVHYTERYENALHFSPQFRRYADDLARRLIARHGLRGKRVIEIGCGDGDFLARLCRLGDNRGLGFDPAHDAGRAGPLPSGVTILPRHFRDEDAGVGADLICCRQVLEHVPDPVRFLQDLRGLAGGRPAVVVFVEVPNGLSMLEAMGIWDVIYEHCLYWSPASLERAFVAAGFEPIAVAAAYGGQFLTIEARSASARPGPVGSRAEDERMCGLVAAFAEGYREKVAGWRATLSRLSAAGARAVLWGAGSKGVTFLNLLEVPDAVIGHVVDANPRKHGCHVPGTGQEIVPPARLAELRPGAVIVMNPLYRDEIAAELRALGIAAEVLTA